MKTLAIVGGGASVCWQASPPLKTNQTFMLIIFNQKRYS